MRAGVEWEGEDPPEESAADRLAILAWNHLTNGMGGIDYGGLPLVVELLGIEDIEGLMQRLLVIKLYTPPNEKKEPPDGTGHPVD